MKIVISAVNLVEGGGLSVLQNCLREISAYTLSHNNVEIIALVRNKNLCFYPNIKYIELYWPKKNWLNRVYFEYVYSYFLSKKLAPNVWLSLHDITPCVVALKRAVYCHNSIIFYHPTIDKLKFNYKEYLFSKFYKYLYRINMLKNDFVIVQQNWLKHEFSRIFKIDREKIIIARPESKSFEIIDNRKAEGSLFFYPAFPRTFKNFEVVCKACQALEDRGINGYRVIITLDGTENLYAKHLYAQYHHLNNLSFCGLLSKEEVQEIYAQTDCLLFPSKLETWGLPISEFLQTERPMLIADLPYAHETAAGAKKVYFFDPDNAVELANRMEEVILKKYSSFDEAALIECDPQEVSSWHALFDKLLDR